MISAKGVVVHCKNSMMFLDSVLATQVCSAMLYDLAVCGVG